jgi:hypothetical protein
MRSLALVEITLSRIFLVCAKSQAKGVQDLIFERLIFSTDIPLLYSLEFSEEVRLIASVSSGH